MRNSTFINIDRNNFLILLLVSFCLNSILFFPAYFVLRDHYDFLPFFLEVHPRGLYGFNWTSLREYTLQIFFRRPNKDIFRLSFDLVLLLGFLSIVKTLFQKSRDYDSNGRRLVSLVSLVYFGLFLFQIYHASIRLILDRSSLILEDRLLIPSGVQFCIDTLSWMAWPALALLILIFALTWFTVKYLFTVFWNKIPLGAFKKPYLVLLSIIAVYSLAFFYHFGVRRDDTTLQILSKELVYNFQRSEQYIERNSLFRQHEDKPVGYDVNLSEKPNIFLLVIESYGMLLFDHPELKMPMYQVLADFEKNIRISKPNIDVLSHYSTAPVFGGSSWLSTASIISGRTIDNQTKYMLFKDTEKKSPHLVNYLNRQGYRSFSLQPGTLAKDDAYGYHKVFDRRDMNYMGDPVGWAAVPDSQTILMGQEYLKRLSSPIFMHYMSVSTHTPWETPPALSDSRQMPRIQRKLYHDPLADGIGRQVARDYFLTISYEWKLLNKLISESLGENFLVAIVGDHQPFIAHDIKSSHDVPIHMISDRKWIADSFRSAGFSSGMVPNMAGNPMVHSDIYQTIMNALHAPKLAGLSGK